MQQAAAIQSGVMSQIFMLAHGGINNTCISAFSHVNSKIHRAPGSSEVPILQIYNHSLEMEGYKSLRLQALRRFVS